MITIGERLLLSLIPISIMVFVVVWHLYVNDCCKRLGYGKNRLGETVAWVVGVEMVVVELAIWFF
jgi:hypothetical protein